MLGFTPQSPDAVRYDRRASFSACSTCRSTHHAPDILAGKLPPPRRCRRRPCRHPARRPANLRAVPFFRRRITSFHGRTRLCMFTKVLLLPRSAPRAPPAAPTRNLPGHARARLPRIASGASCGRSAPSIFGAPRFGRYVVTRFLADADLHGHRPAVSTAPTPSLSVLPLATYPPPRFTPPCGPCLPRAAHWRAPEPRAAQCRHTDTFGVCWQCLHPLYRIFLHARRCPARHFGGNQLPDGSFGLSPLCPCPAIELNIRTAQTLRPYFSGLRSAQA